MKLNVKFEETLSAFPVTLIDDEDVFSVKFIELQIIAPESIEEYSGPYTIYPSFFDQNLETENKKTLSNILVTKIRTFTVSNPKGGNTVFIGG